MQLIRQYNNLPKISPYSWATNSPKSERAQSSTWPESYCTDINLCIFYTTRLEEAKCAKRPLLLCLHISAWIIHTEKQKKQWIGRNTWWWCRRQRMKGKKKHWFICFANDSFGCKFLHFVQYWLLQKSQATIFFLLSYQFSHLHPFGIIVFTIFLGLILSSTKNKVRVSTKSTRHPFQREQRTWTLA